ncbi:MAG TPA: universal stress protein [Deinococcales bacterium]|nr:universal stress protein [Deinococcales bacterium]
MAGDNNSTPSAISGLGKAYRRILVASGGAPHSQAAVARAVELAASLGAELHVVSIVQSVSPAPALAEVPSAGPAVQDAWEDLRSRRQAALDAAVRIAGERGVRAIPHLETTPAVASAIVGTASEHGCDLIVVGRRRLSALGAAILGSVSEAVNHASPVDVLIVRQPHA